MNRLARVLSIQSHVVRGYVGNKSAVFPLQVNGIEVDIINSVQFSNHTGYPSFRGRALDGDELWDLVCGLEDNNLLSGYTHLLTGYIGSVSFLRTIARVLTKLREHNPVVQYVCDPVLGDEGHLYVPADLPAVYRDEIVPLANLLTPNQFELETLTGQKVTSDSDCFRACDFLHEKGIPMIVVTSTEYTPGDAIVVIGSEKTEAAGSPSRFRSTVPRYPTTFTGTGDLFASLMLAHLHNSGRFDVAMAKTLSSIQAVLQRTVEAGSKELLLIASKKDLEMPPSRCTVEHLE
eukprot:Rmarinus@m.25128